MGKFQKNDSQKPRLDLVPAGALEFVGLVLRLGAIKYKPNNWRNCKDPARYVAGMLRHITSHMKGEFTDPESGFPGLAHAICSGMFALELYLKGVQDAYSMGNYFAIVEKRSKKRGLVKKRFTSFERAWAWVEARGLDIDKHIVRTVPSNIKTGVTIAL